MVVAAGLALGGTGRVAADCSSCWIAKGHNVTVATFVDESTDAYRLPPRVRRVALGYRPHLTARKLFLLIRALRREIRRVDPQVVVGLGGIYALVVGLAALGLPCRTVMCEFGVPERNPMRRGREWLRRRAYGLVDAVTSESDPVCDWLKNNTSVRRSVVIPKSVGWPLSTHEPEISPDSACHAGRKIILAGGRLNPVKGLDSLLRAFASVAKRRPDWDLVLLGEGPCREQLESLVADLRLERRVRLPGPVGNIDAWYRRASIFAVSSLHEGGPNTLIEALAHGIPAVSFDCDAGPRTIIRSNVDGILVPPLNEEALARGLARLMDDSALRAQMAAHAVEARERFSEEGAMQKWDELFRSIGIA